MSDLICLDASNNTKLRYLFCYHNHFTSKDVRKNTELEELEEIQLTSLENMVLKDIIWCDIVPWEGIANCYGYIESLNTPNLLKSINGSTLSECTGLTEIISLATMPPTIDSSEFKNVDVAKCILRVPIEAISAYRNAEVWKNFKNIKEFPPN